MNNDELQSKTIDFLRFPLMVCVVFVHAHLKGRIANGVDLHDSNTLPIYQHVSYFFSHIVSDMAVPLFFFISGFLFFYSVDTFSKATYKRKLSKRVSTLLVPYIIWNLIAMLILFMSQTFLSGLNSGMSKPIIDYTLGDFLHAFWDIRGGVVPIYEPFWYIRDLMVMALFSPIVFYVVKRTKYYAALLFGFMWILHLNIPITGLESSSIFFFMTGSYYSIHHKNFVDILAPYQRASIAAYIVMVTIGLCFMEQAWMPYWHHICLLFGMIAVITTTAQFVSKGKWKANSFLNNSSFFLYGLHMYLITFAHKILIRTMNPHSELSLLGIYFLTPLLVIALCLSLYWLLHKYLPKTVTIMCGGRS
ncbi:MAG: acyltransferase [Prevotellaceae bacterium]|jgi:fucose 4-O-acetylase-like acetyltransferase|nr:acyltransferase [Prevotellaceae bacterium]